MKATLTKLLRDCLALYQQIDEQDLLITWEKATKVGFFHELRELYNAAEKDITKKWRENIQMAGSAIIEMSDHIERYNDFYGADMTFGDLWRPKIEPCSEDTSYRKCETGS